MLNEDTILKALEIAKVTFDPVACEYRLCVNYMVVFSIHASEVEAHVRSHFGTWRMHYDKTSRNSFPDDLVRSSLTTRVLNFYLGLKPSTPCRDAARATRLARINKARAKLGMEKLDHLP